MNRARDWLAQAEDDLKWGATSFDGSFFAQVCFVAQQAAEKALNALAYRRGYDVVRGHSVRVLAEQLGINGKIEEAARLLDQYYVSTRYPDSLPAGAPFEVFLERQAREALDLARQIVSMVREAFDAAAL